MALPVAPARPSDPTHPAGAGPAFDPGVVDRPLASGRWPWVRHRRWRAQLAAVLCALFAVVALLHALASAPQVPASWRVDAQGRMVLAATPLPALQPQLGQVLRAVIAADGSVLPIDAGLRLRLPRWTVDDEARARHHERVVRLEAALAQPFVRLEFDDGERLAVAPVARGIGALGALCWALSALALLLSATAAVVLLARPQVRGALYLVMALAQAGQLLLIAVHQLPGLGPPLGFASTAWLPFAFDLVTAAALVHGFALHPHRLPEAGRWAAVAWGIALTLLALAAADAVAGLWWWVQGTTVALGLGVIAVLSRSYHVERHPFTLVLRRFVGLAVVALVLVTLALAVGEAQRTPAQGPAGDDALVWSVCFAALLLLLPFIARAHPLLRELAVLAALGLSAAALGLLTMAAPGVDDPTAVLLVVLLTLAVYAAARRWLLAHLVGGAALDTGSLFEQLYVAARTVQAQPARASGELAALLRGLFEPRELLPQPQAPPCTQVVGDGAALLVPVAVDPDAGGQGPQALLLRHARQGQRIFTRDDAQLADRVVEQLKRAVAYEQAVERGRREERLRIAQDLHDDIGARLLTLMYQAPTPEIEDYLRHTLQDLKTLTRGLASTENRLSHAAGEWKRDATQRLAAARVALDWRFDCDEDLTLSAVQWSGLTRVLRELLSNTIAHAQATRVGVACTVQRGVLVLTVSDDGLGSNPQAWRHGLGLGGVRKRVKLLGGEVAWRQLPLLGIECEVRIPDLRRH